MNTDNQHRDLVTVIIPAYNAAKTLPDAIESLLKQTYDNWFCIIVDDGSTDETQEVLKSYQSDSRIRSIHQENSGVSSARNKAFMLPIGKYLQFLDADDVLHEKKLESQIAFLHAHPEVDVVYSDFVHFTQQPEWNATGEYLEDEKFSNGKQFLRRLLRSNFLRMNTMLFRSSYFKEAGLFNNSFRSVEDYDLWLRGAEKGMQFFFYDTGFISCAVRISPGGLSKHYDEMAVNHLRMLQWHWAYGGLNPIQRWRLLLKYTYSVAKRKEFDEHIEDYERIKFATHLRRAFLMIFPIILLHRIFGSK